MQTIVYLPSYLVKTILAAVMTIVVLKVCPMKPEQSPAEVVRKARKISGLSQSDFGEKVGRSQSVVSKYERGEANPDSSVIIHCMTILTKKEAAGASAKDIADLVQQRLSAPEFAHFRTALMALLQTVTLEAECPSHAAGLEAVR